VSVSEQELALLFTSENESEILRGREVSSFYFREIKRKLGAKKNKRKSAHFFLAEWKINMFFLLFFLCLERFLFTM
jgi:hypothetical protein